MSLLIPSTTNQATLRDWLHTNDMLVACLCAAWCDSCRDYRRTFEALALRHPDKHFLWIDIEDQADMLGDFDVENFPTLLIQRGAEVAFFGAMQPSLQLADRLVHSVAERSITELAADTATSVERQRWRNEIHLARRLAPT
jgi:thioredoxin-like negative regulator of GroEL